MDDNEHPIHGGQRAVITPTRGFKVRLWLSSALWVPVVAGNLLVILVALGLPEIDKHIAQGDRLPITSSTAQAIFAAVAGSMITFTGIVFSAIFIAAQIQTSSYSPRLAAQLRRDPVIMGALVMSTATATYALFALAEIDRLTTSSEDRVPVFTVMFGLVLAVATLAWFAALVQRAFENIQIGGILRTLSKTAWRVVDDVHPAPDKNPSLPLPVIPEDASIAEIEHTRHPGVIAAIDRGALLKLANSTGGFVEVIPQVGEYMSGRTGVLRIYNGRTDPSPKLAESVFVLSRQRTTQQDALFVMRILVDIAIRAISPAINDPTSAVQVLDRVEALLLKLYERHPGPTYVVDSSGEPRALIHAPKWIEYFDLASTEIRRYGRDTIQIHRRLRAMHNHLLDVVTGEERKRVELELQILDETAAEFMGTAHDLRMAREPDRLGIGSI